MELLKTEVKGAHLVEGIAKMLQKIYIPALCKTNNWGGLPALQVMLKGVLDRFSLFCCFL